MTELDALNEFRQEIELAKQTFNKCLQLKVSYQTLNTIQNF